MKKVGILTITDYNNYGNRLQNYATQEVLKSLGLEVETIRMNEPYLTLPCVAKPKVKITKLMKIKHFIKELLPSLKYKARKKYYNNRHYKFIDFSNRNICETDYFIDCNNIPKDIDEKYNYFIIGSDQIWNPEFRYGSSLDFGSFTSRAKRIAYAPSFGISKIPKGYVSFYKKWLNEIEYLSIREQAGARIIKELTGREAKVLVDPTLMLNKEQWLSIAVASKNKPKRKFLLTYILGEKTSEQRNFIKKIAKEYKLDIVSLADIKDKKSYDVDPGEFIDYIFTTQILITDSFHGGIFSILLNKPFVIFSRCDNNLSMDSRIDTLLSKFKLENRKWENIKNTKDAKDILNIDYSHVPEILEYERNKTLIYLNNALDIKGEI